MNRSVQGIPVFIMLLILSGKVFAQSYPRWFLEQGKTGSGGIVAGYSKPYDDRDSSTDQAFLNGCLNFARQQHTHIKGGQAFMDTEIGTLWLGSDIHESFDASLIERAADRLEIIDVFYSDQIAAVLLAPGKIRLSRAMRQIQDISRQKAPAWVNEPPESSDYFYSTGISQPYFYEPSSWLEAEKNARENLAKSVSVRVRQLQKIAEQYQAVTDEDIDVHLRNIEVEARWYCSNTRFFYVLMRVHRMNVFTGE